MNLLSIISTSFIEKNEKDFEQYPYPVNIRNVLNGLNVYKTY